MYTYALRLAAPKDWAKWMTNTVAELDKVGATPVLLAFDRGGPAVVPASLGLPEDIVVTTDPERELSSLHGDFILDLRAPGYPAGPEERTHLPLGTWYFRNPLAEDFDDLGAYEVLAAQPHTPLSLHTTGGTVVPGGELVSVVLQTEKHRVGRNHERLQHRAALLPARALRRLATPGFLPTPVSEPNQKVRLQLVGSNVFGSAAKLMLTALRRRLAARRQRKQWILLVSSAFTNPLRPDPVEYDRIIPPADRFWADPFLWHRDGRDWLFVEEVFYENGKGTLAVMELKPDDTVGEVTTILDLPYHLSYPFLLAAGDELYMIPESSRNGTIDLYRCTDFPTGWVHDRTLMSGVTAVDTTVIEHGGKFWLFTNMNVGPAGSTYDELYLFYADTFPAGEWTPHPLNPVVADIRRARPAGNLFVYDGELYRPSQDCALHYGHGMHLNHITHLSETDYRERGVTDIFPDWAADLKSTHTYNLGNDRTVIDALRVTKQ